MIYDADGNQVTFDEMAAPKPTPHRFGQFAIPEDCHIKGFSGVTGDDPYVWVGYNGVGHRKHATPRCLGNPLRKR